MRYIRYCLKHIFRFCREKKRRKLKTSRYFGSSFYRQTRAEKGPIANRRCRSITTVTRHVSEWVEKPFESPKRLEIFTVLLGFILNGIRSRSVNRRPFGWGTFVIRQDRKRWSENDGPDYSRIFRLETRLSFSSIRSSPDRAEGGRFVWAFGRRRQALLFSISIDRWPRVTAIVSKNTGKYFRRLTWLTKPWPVRRNESPTRVDIAHTPPPVRVVRTDEQKAVLWAGARGSYAVRSYANRSVTKCSFIMYANFVALVRGPVGYARRHGVVKGVVRLLVNLITLRH